jgi:hypothetical protein
MLSSSRKQGDESSGLAAAGYEVRFTALEAALQDGKCLPTERVMGSGDTDSFDVNGIQPRRRRQAMRSLGCAHTSVAGTD